MTSESLNTANSAGAVYQDRWEVVLEGMRSMILNGELAPGSKIREVELAERFGVSRGPIRESLRSLEAAGLVVREPRKSAHVAPVRASDVMEVYSLREAVEVLAVRRALELNRDFVARDLQFRLEQFEAATSAPDKETSRIVEADIHFHDVFYAAADHARLRAVWQSFNDPLRIMMRLSSLKSDPAWREARGGHVSIVNAAIEGDVEACVEATRAHLDAAKEIVLDFVRQQYDS